MNDEWMYGRNKRGCEGIFPVSYVDIRVPLKNYPETDSGTASRSESVSPAGNRMRVLYTFNAEAEGDLTILVSLNKKRLKKGDFCKTDVNCKKCAKNFMNELSLLQSPLITLEIHTTPALYE